MVLYSLKVRIGGGQTRQVNDRRDSCTAHANERDDWHIAPRDDESKGGQLTEEAPVD